MNASDLARPQEGLKDRPVAVLAFLFDRVYCARRIMDILDEPAHLKPKSRP
jgi:hypothetical protein